MNPKPGKNEKNGVRGTKGTEHEHEQENGNKSKAKRAWGKEPSATRGEPGHAARPSADHARVGILDFGSQYGQLIARRVREVGLLSEIFPPDASVETLRARGVRAVILSGGPDSAHTAGARRVDPSLYRSGLAVLGICYGAQRMAQDLGGRSGSGEHGEFGPATLTRVVPGRGLPDESGPALRLLEDLPNCATVWMSHADRVLELPPEFENLASTPGAPLAAFAHRRLPLAAVQFHPEVAHTERGLEILRRFLTDGAGLTPDWELSGWVDDAVQSLWQAMPEGRAIVALSGGVDSAVAAALAARAVGDRLTAVFVDHGLLRRGEGDSVMESMGRLGVRVRRVDAADRFLPHLRGVTDPEEKRRRIGRDFGEVLRVAAEEEAQGGARYLVQGTLYPDVVESGQGQSAVIKTHHNVGALPEDLGLKVVEPLRLLFKDEVRQVGEILGLPPSMVHRQPFPGPGLAVRIAGEVTPERLHLLRECDARVTEELERMTPEDGEPGLFQFFAVLLPEARAVGVLGDQRLYGYPVVLRAVTSEDAMTARAARIPWQVLEHLSVRLPNEVPGVTRVLYDLTTKPPGTIEWE